MGLLKEKLHDIIFEADTRAGRIFDVVLLIVILISVILVMLESVPGIRKDHHDGLVLLEWIITGIFTLEYILRILIVKKPWRYILSFYGIIDFLAVIPTYLGLVVVGYQSLLVIRVLRLLRIFRIFKLTRYTSAGRKLVYALWNSREKISVFIFFIVILVVIIGTLMYLIEGEHSGFTSIPVSIYWAIVTMTTVGYGDISPVTPTGQFLASIVMIMGYAIIAVPTGIVTAEMIRPAVQKNTQVCPNCLYDNHDDDARYCKKCGTLLNPVD
jgi:voltage-gated potassium channel